MRMIHLPNTIYVLVLTLIHLPIASAVGESDFDGVGFTGVVAADRFWIAGSGDWDTDTNWSDAMVPAPADLVTINPSGNTVITGPAAATSIASLFVSNVGPNETVLDLQSSGSLGVAGPVVLQPTDPGGAVSVNVLASSSLEIDTDLTIQSNSTLEADGDATLSVGGNTLIDGGSLRYTTDTTGLWTPGTTIDVGNSGDWTIERGVQIGSDLPAGTTIQVQGAGTRVELVSADDTGRLNIPDATTANVIDGALIGSAQVLSFSGGSLTVEGLGSSLTAESLSVDESFLNELSTISLTNHASAVIDGDLLMGTAASAGALFRSQLTVDDGAGATIGGDILLGTASQAGQTLPVATVTVGGVGASSVITQAGVTSLTIGTNIDGDAVLNVLTNGTFHTGMGPAVVHPTGQINIDGGALHTNGGLTVDGGGLQISGGALTTPFLDIDAPSGLPVSTFAHSGGTLTVEGGVFDRGPSDTYTVDGAGDPHLVLKDTSFSVGAGNRLQVGLDELGRLTIDGGTFLFGGTTYVARNAGSNGTLNIAGHDVLGAPSRLVTTTMFIGSRGTGTMNITMGGQVVGDEILGTRALVGSVAGSVGTVNILGTDAAGNASTWDIDDGLTVASRGTGVLNVLDGGLLSVGGTVAIASNTGGDGAMRVAGEDAALNPATVMIGDALYVGGKATGPGGTGVLNIEPGARVVVANALHVWPNGEVELSGGTLVASAITLSAGAVFDFTDGTLSADDINGDLHQSGGTLSPGESPGITNIAGNYTLAGGTVLIEIMPALSTPTPGTEYDQVITAGSAMLAGTLALETIPADGNPDRPFILGATYKPMIFASASGMFDTITGAVIDTSLAYALSFDSGEIGVRVSIPGDINFDDVVTVADLSTFALNFNTAPGLGNWHLGDFNADGAVTVADLSLLALNFEVGAGSGAASSGLSLESIAALGGIELGMVPEPSMAVSVICLLMARRGRRARLYPPTAGCCRPAPNNPARSASAPGLARYRLAESL